MDSFYAKEDAKASILEGIISVSAAIDAGKREIYNVYVDAGKLHKRDRKILRFVSMLKSKGIPFTPCDRSAIDAYVAENDSSGGSTHGGVVASVGERRFDCPFELLDKCAKEKGFIVFLDGVEDPFNFGYAARSLYAFGASGMIVPERSWESCAGVCARASAGASELLTIASLPSLSTSEDRQKFISKIKKRGFTVGCAAVSSSSIAVDSYSFPFPFFLFIGGEKRGISPEFYDNADVILHIPYANDSVRYSLPTAHTASIFGMALSSGKRLYTK